MVTTKKTPNKFTQDRVEKIKSIILSPYRLFKAICMFTGLFTILVLSIIVIYLGTLFNSLPDLDEYNFKKIKKQAIARTHKRFESKKNIRKYRWTPIKVISRDCLYSIVMSEDGNFFEHEGVNYDAMMDSLARNIRKREYAAGGSTITQQVVKNVFLSHDRTILRKVKEIIITQDLEKHFSKNQILEIYLNIAEFGPDKFGIHMASNYYFKKNPRKINAIESAFAALMLPSPRRYHHSIFKNQYLSKKHKKKLYRVLRDLVHLDLISPKQYDKYRRSYIFKKYR